MPAITMFGGDLVTGEITVRRIPALTGSAVQNLTGGSLDGKVRLPLRDPLTDVVLDLPGKLIPGRSFLGLEHAGKIIECGPIWMDSYDVDSSEFTMTGTGLLGYFDYRFLLPLLSTGQLPRDVSSNWTTSLRTMAKRIVQQAQEWVPALPIVFEDDIAGDNVRTYPGSDLTRVRQALDNLTGVIGGPDIALRAEFKDARHVQWRLVTGDPLLKQDGHDHVWNVSVPGSSVKGTTIERDATVLTSQHFGAGDEVDDVELQVVATDPFLTEAGYPLLESSESRSSVSTEETLQGYADEAVLAGRGQLETWGFSARVAPVDEQTGARSGPWLGSYSAGDFATVVMPKNPRTTKGPHRMRIMEISADLTPWVAITLAPERVIV